MTLNPTAKLTAAAAGPRYERWALVTASGRTAALTLAGGGRSDGRPLGPRQVALLAELTEAPAGISGAELTGRHGTSALAGLVRRGLVAVKVRERPRRPLARCAAGRRGARPQVSPLTPPQAEALGLIRDALQQRDSTPLLLDGVTGGGKTAVYVEAIAASLELGRPVLLLVRISLRQFAQRTRFDLPSRQLWRVARQQGRVEVMEVDEGMFFLGLQAASWRVPASICRRT